MCQKKHPKSSGACVLIIDSGIGGMSIVGELQKLIADVHVIYVADNAVFPYGDKPHQLLSQRLKRIIQNRMNEYDIDAVVIGCNTATVMHIDELREHFSPQQLPLVGVVPPVKTAAQLTKKQSFGVVATENTSRSDYLKNLIDEFAQDCTVYNAAATGLADYVESKIYGDTRDKDELQKIVDKLSTIAFNEIDILVLGCTHYAFIQQELATLLPPHVHIIEPSLPVARRISWILSQRSERQLIKPQNSKNTPRNCFHFTQMRQTSPAFQGFLKNYAFEQAEFLLLDV